jgi:hypothetical protein
MTIVVAARKTWRLVEPVVNRSHGRNRFCESFEFSRTSDGNYAWHERLARVF